MQSELDRNNETCTTSNLSNEAIKFNVKYLTATSNVNNSVATLNRNNPVITFDGNNPTTSLNGN